MPDLSLCEPPPREDLLKQLRDRLGDLAPALRLLAEGFLGAESAIDFVGVEPGGRIVLVLVGEADQDLELVGRGLAQRAWSKPRLRDWLQLAPNIGIRPETGIRTLLLAPAFGAEARAAAHCAEEIELAVYRCVRNGGGGEVLVESLSRAPAKPPPGPIPAAPATLPFRSGLSDTDLGLSDSERREFE